MATSHIIPPKSSTLPHSRSPASSASTSIAPTITPISCTPWHRQTLPVRCAGLVIHYHGQNGHSCVRHICVHRPSGHDAVGMGKSSCECALIPNSSLKGLLYLVRTYHSLVTLATRAL